MDDVRRDDDNEFCGSVDERSDGWHSLTVFGGSLGVYPDRRAAHDAVLLVGLASLMERWALIDHSSGDEQIVCIQEANRHEVTLALDYYSMPGVPTLRIERVELDARRWSLRRAE